MKIAINKCFGLFSVTKPVFDELGIEWDGHGFLENDDFGIYSKNEYEYRSNPALIAALEKIGKEHYNAPYSNINIIDIPDDVKWEIKDKDGVEWISEKHRIWS